MSAQGLLSRRFLLAAAIAAVALWPATGLQADEPVKIGAVEDLTGPTAKYGVAIRQGFELAAAEINAKGGVLGGRKLDLLFEDGAGSKEQSINAVKKLIGLDHVSAVLGPTLSNEMFAAAPFANERKTPIIGTSTTATGITDIGPWVFRTSLPEADVLPVTLQRAREKYGFDTVALMYSNDDAFTKSGADVFKAALEKMGVKIATIETFATKDTDFSPQLTKIKGLNVQAIVVSALAEAGAGLVLQARQLGIPKTVPIIGGNGFNSSKLPEIAGQAADGVIVGSPWFIGKADTANQKFVADFRAKFGTDPDQFAAQAYDTLYILAAALDRAKSAENTKLAEALLQTDYAGVMGPFKFTPQRNPAETTGVVVLQVRDGKFQVLQ